MRIFVVDDHEDIAEGLADVLRLHGHDVEIAHNGQQAIRVFQEQEFDLAFMDVMMPGMNGVESFLEIRKLKPGAKVIMMTGYSVEQLLAQAIDNGAYGVLQKPVAMEEVLKVLERVDSHGMVLVADDDPNFSANVQTLLQSHGYKVSIARTGRQALDTVLAGGIDILVLDLELPVVSGLEVYMELKKRGRLIPTVVVTACRPDQYEALDGLNAISATGILTKPFDSQQLLEALGNIVTEQGGEESEAQPDAPAIGQNGPATAAESVPSGAELPPMPDNPDMSAYSDMHDMADPQHDAPAVPPPPPPPQPISKSHKATRAGYGRILAVDDDVDMVDGLADILVCEGYDVMTANNAEEATALIGEFDAQVALIDLRLGTTNGLELIPVLKARCPNIYCVVVTGNADKESAVTALRSGAYDYMTKPLHPNEIFSVLERCMDKYRLEQEAKAAFEALQIAKDAAETASRAKTEFLATMSQQLRKPVNAILSSSKVMVDEDWGPIGDKRYLDHALNIRDGSTQLLRIISYAMDMAKAASGNIELNESEVDLSALASAVVRLVQRAVASDDAEIEVDLPETALIVRGDERQLKQILLNLLSNAVKFTPEGGRVKLSLQRTGDGGLSLQVADNGIGIAPEDIPLALAEFGVVDNKAYREYQGSGLGLPFVVTMTELHGGNLTLDSDLGEGTTATVLLPAERVVSVQTAAAE